MGFEITFAAPNNFPILTEYPHTISWKTWLLFILKNQVMKKIKLLSQSEDVQARVVLIGFVVILSMLAIFAF